MKRLNLIPIALALVLSACSPTLSPLYRDYDRQQATSASNSFEGSVTRAVETAGWTIAETDLPAVVVTQPRTFKRWGLYRVDVWLEIAPLSDEHVRVLAHPYRIYVTGARSKIPYFRRSLQRAILRDLNSAFAREGIVALGAVAEEDAKE